MPKFKPNDIIITNCKIDDEIPLGTLGTVEWISNNNNNVWIDFGNPDFRWEVNSQHIDLVSKRKLKELKM